MKWTLFKANTGSKCLFWYWQWFYFLAFTHAHLVQCCTNRLHKIFTYYGGDKWWPVENSVKRLMSTNIPHKNSDTWCLFQKRAIPLFSNKLQAAKKCILHNALGFFHFFTNGSKLLWPSTIIQIEFLASPWIKLNFTFTAIKIRIVFCYIL